MRFSTSTAAGRAEAWSPKRGFSDVLVLLRRETLKTTHHHDHNIRNHHPRSSRWTTKNINSTMPHWTRWSVLRSFLSTTSYYSRIFVKLAHLSCCRFSACGRVVVGHCWRDVETISVDKNAAWKGWFPSSIILLVASKDFLSNKHIQHWWSASYNLQSRQIVRRAGGGLGR